MNTDNVVIICCYRTFKDKVSSYALLEACPISKKQYKSLNYVLHSTFRKIFKTKSQDIVNECMLMFNCPSAEETIHKRNLKFLNKYATADNLLCFVCQT